MFVETGAFDGEAHLSPKMLQSDRKESINLAQFS